MTFNIFTAGTKAKSSEVNTNFDSSTVGYAINTMRQLIDRDIDFSAGFIDGFGDAYIDSSGRKNTVNAANTTALYDSDDLSYVPNLSDESSGDSTYNPSSFTNPENAFDGDDSTYAVKSGSCSTGIDDRIGKTFTAKMVRTIRYKTEVQQGGGTRGYSVNLQTFDGAVWTTVKGIGSSEGVHQLNASVEGIRVRFTNNICGGASGTDYRRVYTLEYGDPVDSVIEHDIPAGTTKDTIAKLIGVAIVKNYEEGIDIQFKLSNGSEDTGYFSMMDPEPLWEAYTAFTSEATKYSVQLIVKSSTPTGGYPSVIASWFKATE